MAKIGAFDLLCFVVSLALFSKFTFCCCFPLGMLLPPKPARDVLEMLAREASVGFKGERGGGRKIEGGEL